MATQIKVDGGIAKVGEIVCFKDDYETYGYVTKIVGQMITIESRPIDPADEGFITTEHASRCWIEG